jgi:hypothetical protein
MTNEKPLTKTTFLSTLKEAGLATKDDLKAMEARQDKKYAAKEDLEKLATKDDLLKTERRLKRRMGQHRNEIIVRIGKLATSTPSRKEFDELKAEVKPFN